MNLDMQIENFTIFRKSVIREAITHNSFSFSHNLPSDGPGGCCQSVYLMTADIRLWRSCCDRGIFMLFKGILRLVIPCYVDDRAGYYHMDRRLLLFSFSVGLLCILHP